MVEELIEAISWLVNHLPPGMLEQAAAQAGAVVAALSPWTAASEAVAAIAAVAGLRIEEAAQRLIWMVAELIEAISWLVNHLSPGTLQEAAAQAGAVVAALSPWTAAAEAVAAIADTAGVDISTAMTDLRNAIAAMMTAMAQIAADLQSGGIANAVVFAGQLEAIATSISEAVTSLSEIVSYQGGQVSTAMSGFLADVTQVISDLTDAAVLMTAGNAVAQSIQATGQSIGTAISNGMMAVMNTPGGVVSTLLTVVAGVTTAFTAIQSQFTAMKAAAWHFGYDWVSNIIAGMEDRLGDLEDLLAYIRGLFPSSPAKYGPWRTLPEGDAVGAGFTSDMASGLWGGAGGVVGALGTLRDAFGMSATGPGGMALATAQVGGSGSITININNPTVRSDQDIDRIAAAVGDVLARQASTNSRMGRL
jgi:hypothetical protein